MPKSIETGSRQPGERRGLLISHRLLLAFGLILLPVLAAGYFTVTQMRASNARFDAVINTHVPSYVELSNISLDVSRSISAYYGYLITRNESFRKRRAAGWKTILSAVALYDTRLAEGSLGTQRGEWETTKKRLLALEAVQRDSEEAFAQGRIDLQGVNAIIDKDMLPVARAVMDALRGSPTAREDVRHGLSGVAAENLMAQVRSVDTMLDRVEKVTIGLSAICVLAVLLALIHLRRVISLPLSELEQATDRIIRRDDAVEIPLPASRDEIGAMAVALNRFRAGLMENDRMENEAASRREAEMHRQRGIEQAIRAFEVSADRATATIASAATELEQAAHGLSEAANTTTAEVGTAARTAEGAVETQRSLAQAGSSLWEAASEISRVLSRATLATDQAVSGLRATDASAAALTDAASRIGKVVSIINTLAEQTNLLALNATIEAARAGDAGKGFAVVASEVKALANQTAMATGEISQMIGQIQIATSDTVLAIGDIDRSINEIHRATGEIAQAVTEQEHASHDIAENVRHAAQGSEEMRSVIGRVSETAGHTEQASEKVFSAARGLSAQAETLHAEVERFLAAVRAA